MERRTFEDAFKDAFEGAEVNPSDNAWTNIELDLARTESNSMRRRLVFYKMLAAASIAFALSVAGIGYYMINNSQPNNNQVAQLNTAKDSAHQAANPLDKNSDLEISQENLSGSITNILTPKQNGQSEIASANIKSNNINQSGTKESTPNTELNLPIASLNENNNQKLRVFNKRSANGVNQNTVDNSSIVSASTGSKNAAETRTLPPLYNAKEIKPVFPDQKTQADPVALMFARLAEYEKELAGEEDKKENVTKEKLWTSLGFAAGGFNTVNPSVSSTPSNAMIASSSSVADKQVKASGVAYSIGVSMGTQLSNRWVLQGGVSYLTQLSDYTATEAVSSDFQNFKAASLNELKTAESQQQDSRVFRTAPYNVNNNVRFISVPLQAGYLVVNRKVGVQLNAGVATDLFLQNTIDPEGGSLERTTQRNGSDSPYRSVNFSGLVGTEFSYKFSDRYRVSLNPGLRYPFSSIYKTDLGVNATPLTFDVGLRFRYIFR